MTRAARHVPFKAVCLPQAMAARVMLKRRGVASVMHFGAARGQEKPLDAHAWLDAAGVEVTGYPVAKQFRGDCLFCLSAQYPAASAPRVRRSAAPT